MIVFTRSCRCPSMVEEILCPEKFSFAALCNKCGAICGMECGFPGSGSCLLKSHVSLF